MDIAEDELVFVGEERRILFFKIGGGVLSKPLIIKEVGGQVKIVNVSLAVTDLPVNDSSKIISADHIRYNQNYFNVSRNGFEIVTVIIDISDISTDVYQGKILVTANNIAVKEIGVKVIVKSSLLQSIVLLWVVSAVVIGVGAMLFLYPKQRKLGLFFSTVLIFVSYILLIMFGPLDSTKNSVLGTVLFTPLIAYVIGSLKVKRDYDKEIEKASHTYRNNTIKEEGAILAKILVR